MSNVERLSRSTVRGLIRSIVGIACAAALVGCASRGRQAIPDGASVVESGIGTVDYEANRDGDVWVYDADTEKLTYMGEVRKDQTVRVNARSDQVTIGGKTVSERPISDEHKYQIFFRRDQQRVSRGTFPSAPPAAPRPGVSCPIEARGPVMVNPVRLAAATLVAACLAGAQACSGPRGVPSGSNLVTEATVKSSFQAPTDGMLWIFRTPSRGSRGQLHYSGPIAAGQVLVIDPSMNKATIDGQELELVLPGGDVWYQAYFRADRSVRRVLAARPPGARQPAIDQGAAPAEPNGAAPMQSGDSSNTE